MLASTVQFSKYGRAHLPPAPTYVRSVELQVVRLDSVVRVARLSTCLKVWRKRPIPQDPTVCLVVMFFRGIVPALGRT